MPDARIFVLGVFGFFLAGCSAAPDKAESQHAGAGELLFAWVTDADSADLNFLAVIDAREGTGTYGTVLASLAIPASGRTRGHHVEHVMSESGRLFANDFGTGVTYIIDLTDPLAPFVADSFTAAGELMSPHSFERLPNGNVLATFQNRGPGNAKAGGIAELDESGRMVRGASAEAGDRYIRPYSLALVPELDRVVTGSADMRGAGDSRVVQVWRLSDLALLHTIDIPEEWGAAAEPRVLADGRTVLIATFGCSLLRVTGLDTSLPGVERVHEFGGSNCALPTVAGNYWIQTVPDDGALVALDVQQPDAPREVSRLQLGDGHWPHWISLSPQSNRLVVTGYAATRHRVIMVQVDTATGLLTMDTAFGADDGRPGISFERDRWPHGTTGPGDPHGVVFSRSDAAWSQAPPSPYFGQPVPGETPELFAPGVVSTDAVELNGVFSPDLREFFFSRLIDSIQTMFHSVLEDGVWSSPRPLYLFPGETRAIADDMAFSPDGQLMYFLGKHPNLYDPEGSQIGIWVSERVDGTWSTARVVPPPVSIPDAATGYPVVVADGSLYFASDRPGGPGPFNVFRVQRLPDGSFGEPVNVGPPVNSEHGTGDTYVAPDESYMILTSSRPPSLGRGDLFVSFRLDDGGWGEPIHLGDAINTDRHEYCPMVTPDGKYLFFSRFYGGSGEDATGGDVFWVDASILDRFRP